MLQIRSAREAIAIFCRSERIYHDFEIALRHTDRFVENFVVRKWCGGRSLFRLFSSMRNHAFMLCSRSEFSFNFVPLSAENCTFI